MKVKELRHILMYEKKLEKRFISLLKEYVSFYTRILEFSDLGLLHFTIWTKTAGMGPALHVSPDRRGFGVNLVLPLFDRRISLCLDLVQALLDVQKRRVELPVELGEARSSELLAFGGELLDLEGQGLE